MELKTFQAKPFFNLVFLTLSGNINDIQAGIYTIEECYKMLHCS